MTNTRRIVITTAQELVTRCLDAIADFASSPVVGTHFADYRRQAESFLALARKRTTSERLLSVMRGDMRRLGERVSWTYERAVGGEISSPVTMLERLGGGL